MCKLNPRLINHHQLNDKVQMKYFANLFVYVDLVMKFNIIDRIDRSECDMNSLNQQFYPADIHFTKLKSLLINQH